MKKTSTYILSFLTVFVAANVCLGQDTIETTEEQAGQAAASKSEPDKSEDQRFKKFTEEMKNVKLIGTFTIDGRGGKLSEEEYIIKEVKKTDEGNYWIFKTRIKYGKTNVTVPLVLPVEWAGDTPMISITDLKIPLVGAGSFGAKVIFTDGKYAGTWNHDKVGGHMFGRIEKIVEEKKPRKKR